MQNLLRSILLIFFLVIDSVEFELIVAQCPGGTSCQNAYPFCSLDELNGFSCNNIGGGKNKCNPDCSNFLYSTLNASWWTFISQGGNVNITLTYGVCVDTDKDNDLDGLNWGIWGDCSCGEQIFCSQFTHPATNSQSFQGYLKPCKTYYIWIGGHENATCDFTISTSGGGPVNSDLLGFINAASSGIIEPVCLGACNYKFFISSKGTCPLAYYIWTIDGLQVGANKNEIQLDFPEQGDFTLCVTGYSGNPNAGNICQQEGPKCATVKVRQIADRYEKPKVICYESANPGGFKWNSQFIHSSGIYTERFKDKCCFYDSVLDITVLPEPQPTEVFFISCDNAPYVDLLGRKYYPCTDHVYISFPNSSERYKCDSVITLTSVNVDYSVKWQARCIGNKVEHSPNITILKKCSVGESYNFDYKWYNKNDTAKMIISTNENLLVDDINQDYCIEVNLKVRLASDSSICTKIFCDSINEANVTSSVENLNLYYCDSARINTQSYTQSTQFTQQLKNIFGCDSTIITNLNISKSSSSNLVLNSCDSVIVNSQVYFQSGSFKQFMKNVSGCDSLINLDLSIPKSIKKDLLYSSCDSISINGQKYFQPGNYTQKLQSATGCDSILNLNLSITKSTTTNFSFSACDSVNFNGKTYKQSGDYTEAFISVNGCDSILKIHVNIPNSNTSPFVQSTCDSAIINNQSFYQSGNYTQLLKSVNGCDSILNIDLKISKSNSSVFSLSSCDSAVINSVHYFQSGNYVQLLQNVNHCDSLLNINLTIQTSNNSDLTISSCDSARVNGQLYKLSGNYTQVLKNRYLCDSTLNIHFTLLNKSISNFSFTSCDSVIVNNQIYKQSGNYSQTLKNSNFCDSILNLNVNVTKSSSANYSLTSCDSANINGQMYSQSGNYVQILKNINLCDSILNVNLNIFKSSTFDYALSSCDSTIVNGQIYKISGNYIQNLKSANQCDSTLNILFSHLVSTESNLSQTVCDSININGITYSSSGSYLQKLINAYGCDSTLKIELIIKPGNTASLEAGQDTSICEGEIVKLNGLFSPNSTVGTNILWQSGYGSFDSPNSLITNYYPGSIGDERIYLQAAGDCSQLLDSLTIHVLPRQIVYVTGDSILNPCKQITFTASGGTNYIWTPSSFIECLDPPCSRVLLKSTVATRFTISTDGPCAEPTTFNLSLAKIQTDIYLPNAFSPNGDNINDVFLPVFNCELVDFYNLQIFDRWGNLLFESQNKEKGWDGKYQDLKMNPGVYPYVVQYQVHGSERKVKAGDVTLVR